jgi:hypothetical protein
MDKKQWKTKIKSAAKKAGTYQPFFDAVIDTLAGILEKRDTAQEVFDRSGGNVVIAHTNKGGATNLELNPALRLINDLNRDALAYWRDLGLTPAGLKRINEAAMQKKEKGSALEEALKSIGGA